MESQSEAESNLAMGLNGATARRQCRLDQEIDVSRLRSWEQDKDLLQERSVAK